MKSYRPTGGMMFLALLFAFIHVSGLSAYGGDEISRKPWEYSLGEGMSIADTGLRLGGYASVEYEDATNDSGKLYFDDLSLFIFGDISRRWSFFSEVEEAHFAQIDVNGRTTTHSNAELERLHLDYMNSDRLGFRAGKFLTPIGIWNEIHAEPLTWTVSRPLVSFLGFPEFTTGIELFGDIPAADGDIGYSVFLQNNQGLQEKTNFRNADHIFGGRVRWLGPRGVEAGIPLLYYKEDSGDRVYMTGFDFSWRAADFNITAEGTYGSVDPESADPSHEYGYYLQGVYSVTARHSLVLRHEYLKGRAADGIFRALSVGGVYKLTGQVVFKGEYLIRGGSMRLEDVNSSDEVLFSSSILF
ncbi:MAG: outer membrane beta-barrel protein [Deltaproteobacteria bacterium]|nr:outer membrane beta-barrel protein [Deltaproteobacteria bacterium]